ncbi:hypothetical protein ILUMI_21598 [Ignelater luminosus]|uniref:Uncharacterized protein n=1 Tax=Ignelater luminosus TaxID=2038154 RepID=A0A8K0CC42_IGNLU|nr:hypothetical protein ILUMI_21598 [Ignelater luminosus]
MFVVVGKKPYELEAPTCEYKRRLRKEEIAVPIAALIVVIILGVLMTPLYVPEEECKTDLCTNESIIILRNINPEINPCDDFFQFACGRKYLTDEINNNPVTDNDKLIEQTRRDILKLYNEPIKREDHHVVNAMKMLFKTCVESGEDSVARVKEVFDTIGGGWPLIEGSNWEETRFDWIEATYKLRELGYPFAIFLDVTVDDDPRNRHKAILKVKLPYYFMKNESNTYFALNNDTVYNVAKIFEANTTNDVTNDLEDLSKFANLTTMLKGEISRPYLPYTISDIQKDIPAIDWLTFIHKIVTPTIEIDSGDYEILMEQNSIKKWLDIISKTSKRLQANYMMWMVLQQTAPFLTSKLKNFIFPKKELEKPQEEFCYNIIQKRFTPNPVSILYAKTQLFKDKRKDVSNIVGNLKEALLDRLKKDKRLLQSEKTNIKEKLSNMTVVIGEPESYFANIFFDELFTDRVQFDNKSLLDLFTELNKNYVNYMYGTIEKPKLERHFRKWYMKPTWYFMYYDSRDNMLRLPTTQLQTIAFNENKPKYLTYGTVGKKIAEQLSMLLRFTTSLYDKDGNSTTGWSPETIVAFRQGTSCLENDMEKFNSTTFSYLNFEYQAQVIASKLCYEAYRKWVKLNGKETKLDIYYNQKQLFWISTAVCRLQDYSYFAMRNPSLMFHYSSEDLEEFPRLATYAIARHNFEFKKYFKCPPEALMTSSKRCQLV